MNVAIILTVLILLIIAGMKKFRNIMREFYSDDEGSPVQLNPLRINKYK